MNGEQNDLRAVMREVKSRPAVERQHPGSGESLKEISINAARAAERQAICDVLRTTKGNKSQAAKVLRTDYKTLHVKIKALGIRPRDFASQD